MSELLKTTIGRLRVIAFAEGVSFLLILFVSMPLKYAFDMPEANEYIGMLHGVLFILYVLAVVTTKIKYNWSTKTMFIALLVSVIPFGTFWADKKIFSQTKA